MTEVVYFELNNWTGGEDYPMEEPFISWMGNDLKQKFANDKWAKENKICVLFEVLDMSFNYLVTAPKSWVLENCPNLLTKHKQFLRFPEEDDDLPYGGTDTRFLEYDESNFGVTRGEDW